MNNKIIISVAGLALAFMAGWFVNGWRLGLVIAEMERDNATELAKASEEARKREAALLAQNEKLQGDLKNAKTNAKKLAATRDADIDAGQLRLTVAVRGPGENSTAEPGQTRAELEPAFGKSLFAITDDGDAAIHELNYCIDAYNSAIAHH